jgi:hypothetical protein
MRALFIFLLLFALPAGANEAVNTSGAPKIQITPMSQAPEKSLREANIKRGQSITLPRAKSADDAPPPRAAPRRKDVDVLRLAAPFGIVESAAAPPKPRYAPMAGATKALTPNVKPNAKPRTPDEGKFTLSFSRLQIEVSDALPRWQNAALPVSLGPNLALFLQTVAFSARQNPTQRLEIRAYAAQGGWQSEARRLALVRALAVYQWLTDQGVRPTQIDWYAMGKPLNGAADRVDILLRSNLTLPNPSP